MARRNRSRKRTQKHHQRNDERNDRRKEEGNKQRDKHQTITLPPRLVAKMPTCRHARWHFAGLHLPSISRSWSSSHLAGPRDVLGRSRRSLVCGSKEECLILDIKQKGKKKKPNAEKNTFTECVAKGSRLTWESKGRAVCARRCF